MTFLKFIRVTVFSLAICSPLCAMATEESPIRIVFMGMTGAGKSTVVNAFYNFAQQVGWRDFPKLFPIPTEFQKCNVEKYIGQSAECHARRQLDAVTQSPFEYLVEGHDCRLSFIDCPGTGDPRGIMQDCRYADVTARFLSELIDFHAFCIVVKSTMNRQTIEDLYCLEQIKVIIPKKARDRIFVVVTHDTGSRENIPSFLRELDIPCENIFYFDNFGLTVDGYFEPSSEKIALTLEDQIIEDPFLEDTSGAVVDRDVLKMRKLRDSWLGGQQEFDRLKKKIKSLNARRFPDFTTISRRRKNICEYFDRAADVVKSHEASLAKLESQKKMYADCQRVRENADASYSAADDDYMREVKTLSSLSPQEANLRAGTEFSYYLTSQKSFRAWLASAMDQQSAHDELMKCEIQQTRDWHSLKDLRRDIELEFYSLGTLTLCGNNKYLVEYLDRCIRREQSSEKREALARIKKVLTL